MRNRERRFSCAFLSWVADFRRDWADGRIGFDFHGFAEEFRLDTGKHRVVESKRPGRNFSKNGAHAGRQRRGGGFVRHGIHPGKSGEENGALRMRFLRYDGKSRKSEHFFSSYDGVERPESCVISENSLRRNPFLHKGELHAFNLVIARRSIVSRYEKAVDPLIFVEFGGGSHTVGEIGVTPAIGELWRSSKHESDGVFRNGT